MLRNDHVAAKLEVIETHSDKVRVVDAGGNTSFVYVENGELMPNGTDAYGWTRAGAMRAKAAAKEEMSSKLRELANDLSEEAMRIRIMAYDAEREDG